MDWNLGPGRNYWCNIYRFYESLQQSTTILIGKIEAYGIGRKISQWIKNFIGTIIFFAHCAARLFIWTLTLALLGRFLRRGLQRGGPLDPGPLCLVRSQARGLKFSMTTYENNLSTDSKFHKVILNSFLDMSICHTPLIPGLSRSCWRGLGGS